jgi:hypothetical protein
MLHFHFLPPAYDASRYFASIARGSSPSLCFLAHSLPSGFVAGVASHPLYRLTLPRRNPGVASLGNAQPNVSRYRLLWPAQPQRALRTRRRDFTTGSRQRLAPRPGYISAFTCGNDLLQNAQTLFNWQGAKGPGSYSGTEEQKWKCVWAIHPLLESRGLLANLQ